MPDFIPVDTTVHYKCAFDVTCQGPATIMTRLRQMLRDWCIKRTGSNEQTLHRRWFYSGNNPKVEPAQYTVNGHQIRTVCAPSDDPNEPTCWALEVIHTDDDESSRKWSVEVTLRKNAEGTVRFATVVRHWMIPYFIGEYPESPVASTPGYVRAILETSWLTCTKGDARINSRPWYVNNRVARELFGRLRSSERLLPFVLVSRNRAGDAYCIDPVKLSNSVLGNANVYPLDNSSVNDELAYYFDDAGRVFRCDVGSVRVYLPRLDLTDPDNARFHRYFSEAYIAKEGEDVVTKHLINGLSRNASTFRADELLSFQSIFSVRRKYMITKLAESGTEKAEEVAMLVEDNQELSTKAAEWEGYANQYSTENDDLKREVGGLRHRVQEAERVRRRIEDLESQLNGIRQFAELPTSLDGVLAGVAGMFPARLRVTDDAIASAKEYGAEYGGHWNRQEQLALAWTILFDLCTKLHPLLFDSQSRNLEDDFSAVSRFPLAMSEGKQTKKDSKLMKERKILFEGRELDIAPHLKYGNKPPKMLRLHFYVDGDSRRFIVGFLGEHLENYTSRKR